jgi:hypoxanthine-DNA glycosylase
MRSESCAGRYGPATCLNILTMLKLGLPPLVWPESRVLVLGTLPSDESLRVKQYYANPSNQFWKILAAVFGLSMPSTYAERVEYLRARHVGLWDVVRAAERKGSQDGDIKNPQPNDFGPLLAMCPNLRAMAVNGALAQDLFKKFVDAQIPPAIHRIWLPSTSGIPGRNVPSFQGKVQQWKAIAGV